MSVEESPEFKKALQKACETQYREYLYGGGVVTKSKDKIGETMEEIQRQRKEIEVKFEGARLHAERVRKEAEIISNPYMREITENLRRVHGQGGGLVCPVCGERDHKNRMGGKPVCFMNHKHKEKGVEGPVLLVSPEKVKDWKSPQKKSKPRELTFKDIDVARVRK